MVNTDGTRTIANPPPRRFTKQATAASGEVVSLKIPPPRKRGRTEARATPTARPAALDPDERRFTGAQADLAGAQALDGVGIDGNSHPPIPKGKPSGLAFTPHSATWEGIEESLVETSATDPATNSMVSAIVGAIRQS